MVPPRHPQPVLATVGDIEEAPATAEAPGTYISLNETYASDFVRKVIWCFKFTFVFYCCTHCR